MPAKLGLGLVLLAIGMFVMVVAATNTHGGADKVGPWWLVTTYFIHTVGELCLSPVGLSSVTKLAPRRLVGQMMGTFFMGNALGNLIAGLTAGAFSSMPLPTLFGTIAKVTGAGGLLLLVFSGPVRRLIGVLPTEAESRLAAAESEVPA
jgi:POT family proton-dependent oligopeptide transporter